MMHTTNIPNQNELRNTYEAYLSARRAIIHELESRIETALWPLHSYPRVKGRVKNFESFYKKYLGLLKQDAFHTPLITDLIGLRVVCPFFEDTFAAKDLLGETFEIVEVERKGSSYSFKEFGYESIHLLIKIPPETCEQWGDCGLDVAEVQIRTLLQDAWAEVEHELVYKAEFTPFDEPMKRKLAALNASLSLADTVFQEIRTYQRQLNGELGKRRDSFFRKIEDWTDGLLFDRETAIDGEDEEKTEILPLAIQVSDHASIDDLLLNALYAHNRNEFEQAIDFYTCILAMQPDNAITSLIYKHRGMANFAQSHYDDAIVDFTCALELDPISYKAAYYRGVVQQVLQHYPEAIDDFSLSLLINPYQTFCLYRRGQAYYHISDLPQALADCDAALTMDTDYEPALKFKELLLQKLKM
jgi:putative GTP pyrophosphokinase